jgi:hypothetical protein
MIDAMFGCMRRVCSLAEFGSKLALGDIEVEMGETMFLSYFYR